MATSDINEHDRVRSSSTKDANRTTDQKMIASIARYGYKDPVVRDQRIKELNKEWSIERALEVNASTLVVIGVLLGYFVNKLWLILPGIVGAFLLQHGLQGWCPPLPILRKLGFRSRKEIDNERYSLKVLRGDFENAGTKSHPEELLKMVRK